MHSDLAQCLVYSIVVISGNGRRTTQTDGRTDEQTNRRTDTLPHSIALNQLSVPPNLIALLHYILFDQLANHSLYCITIKIISYNFSLHTTFVIHFPITLQTMQTQQHAPGPQQHAPGPQLHAPPGPQQYHPGNQQYNSAPQQYPTAPQQYPTAPQQYHPGPQQYAPGPQQYAPAPQQYAPAPAPPAAPAPVPAPAPAPQPYHSAPQQYPTAPQQYPPPNQPYNQNTIKQQPAPGPQQYAPGPQQYHPGPQQYSPINQHYPPAPQQQPQQERQKLDPNLMPSVVQMINEEITRFSEADKHIKFTAPALLPPLVTTLESPDLQLVLQDEGCSRPCHIRSTIYQVPTTKDILDASGLDLGVIVKPFDDREVDGGMFIPQSPSEIVRCNRCMAYMNPYMRFIEGGKSYQCCLCSLINETPQSYFCPVDHNFNRLDKLQRPELHLGSYEFKATKNYYRNELEVSRRPHIIFAFEMTQNSRHVINYVSKYLADIIKENIPSDFAYSIPMTPLVGFIGYNSKIYMYDVANGGHAYVICDVASAATMASTSQFLLDPIENYEQIKLFLEALPTLCSDSDLETQTVLGPVIEAAFKTCAADTTNWLQNESNSNQKNARLLPNQQEAIPAGKIYMFHCSLPTYGDATTPGRLMAKRNPDDMRRALGTDKEKEVLAPNPYYTTLAQKCITDYASGVELFLFPSASGPYLDVASIGELARLTGSNTINKYFNEPTPDKFIEDLKYSLRSTVAFDAQMRVRTSPGISPCLYLGNFSPAIGSNYDMSAVNTTSNITVQLNYDDKLHEKDLVVIQFAMIYTSLCGERRIRVHNLALSTCTLIQDLYRTVCCDTTVNLIIKESMQKLKSGSFTSKQVKEQLNNRIVAILIAYRKHCAQPESAPSQLILPEGMKLLPMYLCGALKCDAIDGGSELFPDDKALSQIHLLGSTPAQSQVTLYPRLYSIEACKADQENNIYGLTAELSRCYRLVIEEQHGQCYVLENGYYLFIYFPSNDLGAQFLTSVFGRHKDDDYLNWVSTISDAEFKRT